MTGTATTRPWQCSGRACCRGSSTILRKTGGPALIATCAATLALATCSPAIQPGAEPSASPARALPALRPGQPLFAGASPANLVLDAKPLDVDPGGAARFLVRARFIDASGHPTILVQGGDVGFHPSSGTAQWQTRLRFGGPAAIVSVFDEEAVAVRVHADVGASVPDARIALSTHSIARPHTVARALGPHSVWIGWFPRMVTGVAGIVRTGHGRALTVGSIAAPSSGYRDDTVAPGASYRYAISFANRPGASARVDVPAEFRAGVPAAMSGKGAWLSFSPSADDPDGYDKLDPSAIVKRAAAAGLRSIYLRTSYGPFREITPADRATVDTLLDLAAAEHVAVVAWTVPRSLSFDDFASEIEAVEYRSARGHGFAALAVDLERGDYFLGHGPDGYAALGSYLHILRAAIGRAYPIVATVEDPQLEHLTDAEFPFSAIARDASVLQPMVYWRLVLERGYSLQTVRETIAASYVAMRRESQSALPINVGLQTSAQNSRGAPKPQEIGAAIASSRRAGATGVTFFDWGGTSAAAWDAIAHEAW